MTLPTCRAAAFHAVSRVVRYRTQQKMPWTDARRVVADMPYEHAGRNLAERQRPSHARSTSRWLFRKSKDAVSGALVTGRRPKPARLEPGTHDRPAAIHLRPKALLNGLRRFELSVCIARGAVVARRAPSVLFLVARVYARFEVLR